MLLITVTALALTLLAVVLVMVRVFANVGPRGLEDYARQKNIVYIPVHNDLFESLQDWSKPVKIRLEQAGHPLLAEMSVQKLGAGDVDVVT